MIDKTRVDSLNDFLNNAIEEGDFPGYIYGIVRGNGTIINANGHVSNLKEFDAIKVNSDTIYDIASLTKVVATVTCILLLIQEGKISLDMRVTYIIPEFQCDNIRIKHLLTHTSGLDPDLDYTLYESKESILEHIIKGKVIGYSIGEEMIYSDLGYILLGEIIERLTGNFEEYFMSKVAVPLNMTSTFFNPLAKGINKELIAPTELCKYRQRHIRGDVHDEKAYIMGGVSGHAGLFSTIEDMLKFVRMLLNKGKSDGQEILHERVVDLLKNYTVNINDETRTLGWITNNSNHGMGYLVSKQAIFHTGFVGTSILVDFEEDMGIVLLTNRVHPYRDNHGLIVKRGIIHNLGIQCKSNTPYK